MAATKRKTRRLRLTPATLSHTAGVLAGIASDLEREAVAMHAERQTISVDGAQATHAALRSLRVLVHRIQAARVAAD